MGDSIDSLLDSVASESVRALSYEEREALAKAIRAGSLDGAALSPRALAPAKEIVGRLDAIDQSSREHWARVVAEELTMPRDAKPLSQISNDELDRELERREKFRLRGD